ncbi:MAG: L-2-amino-thiazoline-4-carboxylic acid hydrolase [Chloroflexota bacterium]
MGAEDTFIGAKSGLTFLNAYIGAVAEEIGRERALALDGQVCEAIGAAQGKMMREQAGIDEFDAQAASQMLSGAIYQGFGIVSEAIEESPETVVLKCGRCPVYEAALAVGMDAEAIEATCRVAAIGFMDAMAKELNPGLSYELREFRPAADDSCIETVTLA